MLGGNLYCGFLARIRALLAPPNARSQAGAPVCYPILPVETWAAISAHLHGPADLSALSQTCRLFRRPAQARLFLRVDLLELRNLEDFSTTLQRDYAAQGPLGCYVRLLRIMLDTEGALEGRNLGGAVDALRTVLAHCTKLRVLSLPNWTSCIPGGALPKNYPLLSSLEVRVDEGYGDHGPWFMDLLYASPELRELRVWGTFALPSGVSEKLKSFTGDILSSGAAIRGRSLQRIHLVGAVDADQVVCQLHLVRGTEHPGVELLLRPTSDQPSAYLSSLRNGFPFLRRLTILGVPSKFIDEVNSGAAAFPKWPSLRELVIYCDDEEGLELNEPAFSRCLLRDHRGPTSISVRKALPYDLCLKDIMRVPD